MADEAVAIKDAADVTRNVAADEVSSKFYPLVKLVAGGDGVVAQYLHTAYRTDTYTGTGNGVTVDVSAQGMSQFGIEVTATGGTPTSWTANLQVSFDGVTFSTVESHVNGTNALGTAQWTLRVPARYFRSNVSALVLGPATNIIVKIIGMP